MTPYEDEEKDVPDYFEDPMEKFSDEIGNRFMELAQGEVPKEVEDSFVWAAGWLSQYDDYDENAENEKVPTEFRILQHLVQQDFLLSQILKQLKKMNGDSNE